MLRVSIHCCSVLINFYLRRTGNAYLNGVTIENINNAFEVGVDASAADDNDNRIRSFYGTNAIALSNDTYGMIEQNVHPGSFKMGGMRINETMDPVLNAVILGSWDRKCLSVNLFYFTHQKAWGGSIKIILFNFMCIVFNYCVVCFLCNIFTKQCISGLNVFVLINARVCSILFISCLYTQNNTHWMTLLPTRLLTCLHRKRL